MLYKISTLIMNANMLISFTQLNFTETLLSAYSKMIILDNKRKQTVNDSSHLEVE